MTDTERLNEIIDASGYKRSFIAKQVGLSPFGLANKINNVYEFKTGEINALCALLGIDSLEDKEAIFFKVSPR